MQKPKVYGGIEAGGTKFICVIGDISGQIFERARIPTSTPEKTMAEVIDFFKEQQKKYDIQALGIATFGPIILDRNAPNYGYIYAQHKTGWDEVNMVGIVKKSLSVPIGFDTDVNGAAIGEHRWGAGKGLDNMAYWTIGTGIGVGIISNGAIVHGLTHPEAGHINIYQDLVKDPFEGICVHHKNCFEGLASGPSIQARWKVKSAMDLPEDHPAWNLEAEYIGRGMANCILNSSPQLIILGGGVMGRASLYPKVRQNTLRELNGLIKHRTILEGMDNYIVPPSLGSDAGSLGAIALADQAYKEENL